MRNYFLACFFFCIVGFLSPTLYFALSSFELVSFCLYSLLSLSTIQGIMMVFCYHRVLEWLTWRTMDCLHNWYVELVMTMFWLVIEDGVFLELAPPCLFAPKVFIVDCLPCVYGERLKTLGDENVYPCTSVVCLSSRCYSAFLIGRWGGVPLLLLPLWCLPHWCIEVLKCK